MEEVSKYFVEPPQTAEARRQRNFSHGHPRLMDEVLGEKHTSGLCDSNWRRPQMLKKEPPQLTLANAKAFCKRIHTLAFAIESALGDERQRSGDRVGRPAP
jgi:hypothetical protein